MRSLKEMAWKKNSSRVVATQQSRQNFRIFGVYKNMRHHQ